MVKKNEEEYIPDEEEFQEKDQEDEWEEEEMLVPKRTVNLLTFVLCIPLVFVLGIITGEFGFWAASALFWSIVLIFCVIYLILWFARMNALERSLNIEKKQDKKDEEEVEHFF